MAEGDTIFIAGLISDRTLEQQSKIPVLGDIPLLGGLFKRTERETRRTDMVILLTPTIMSVGTAADYATRRLEEQENFRESLNSEPRADR